MSIVTIQVGQCGNQVGAEFFSTLVEDLKNSDKFLSLDANEAYKNECTQRFFTECEVRRHSTEPKLQARAVLIDMEEKVIAETQRRARIAGWSYPAGQALSSKSGSGNNWARGYCEHGIGARETLHELLRREAERADHLGGVLVLLSLAGGTGSGLGTYVTEQIRQLYPKAGVLAQAVWPFSSGEVSVQNYNAVLTLSRLYACADGVLCSQNDDLQGMCRRLLALDKVTFQHLNSVLARQLAGVLQPSVSADSTTNSLDLLIEQCVPHPGYRLLGARCVPLVAERSRDFSTFTWSGLIRCLRQMLIASAPMEEGIDWNVHLTTGSQFNKSVSNLLVLRGQDAANVDISSFQDPRLYPSWNTSLSSCNSWVHPRGFLRNEKTAVLVSNCAAPTPPLERLVTRAWNMFARRAYVHQYTDRGVDASHFLDSFAALEQVLHDYKQLSLT